MLTWALASAGPLMFAAPPSSPLQRDLALCIPGICPPFTVPDSHSDLPAFSNPHGGGLTNNSVRRETLAPRGSSRGCLPSPPSLAGVSVDAICAAGVFPQTHFGGRYNTVVAAGDSIPTGTLPDTLGIRDEASGADPEKQRSPSRHERPCIRGCPNLGEWVPAAEKAQVKVRMWRDPLRWVWVSLSQNQRWAAGTEDPGIARLHGKGITSGRETVLPSRGR